MAFKKFKKANPGEGKESNFQSYHIIIEKHSIFSKKNHRAHKETRKCGSFKADRTNSEET